MKGKKNNRTLKIEVRQTYFKDLSEARKLFLKACIHNYSFREELPELPEIANVLDKKLRALRRFRLDCIIKVRTRSGDRPLMYEHGQETDH